jgi:hypothetical protein
MPDALSPAERYAARTAPVRITGSRERGYMSQSIQIMCINKTPRNDPHDRIENVGGVANGKPWKISQPVAIAHIESGEWQFYVSAGGKSVWVIVAVSAYGHKYLKTQNDGAQPDNLLSLPECP